MSDLGPPPSSLNVETTLSGFEVELPVAPEPLLAAWIRTSPVFWLFLAVTLPMFVCLGLDAAFPGERWVLGVFLALQFLGILLTVLGAMRRAPTPDRVRLDGVRLTLPARSGDVEVTLGELRWASARKDTVVVAATDAREWVVDTPDDAEAARWVAALLSEVIEGQGTTQDVPERLRRLQSRLPD
jgi:hypothetical protein